MGWGQFFISALWNMTKSVVKSIWGGLRYVNTRLRIRRDLRKKQEENRQNRMLLVEGEVLMYNNLSQISGAKGALLEGEATIVQKQFVQFENRQGNYDNTIISGGSPDIRSLALLRICENMYSNGGSAIIIHCSNHTVESSIASSSIIGNKLIINLSNSLYDPFLGLTTVELTNLFMESTPAHIRQNWSFSVLVSLIAELYYIRQRKNITLKLLLKMKVSDLPDKIQDSRCSGLIDDKKMSELIRRYQSAQSEVSSFQQYLTQLQSKFEQFYANSNGNYRGIGKALCGNRYNGSK